MRDFLIEGGIAFMGTITLLLVLILVLAILSLKAEAAKKEILVKRINTVSLFTLVFGIFSQVLGLVQIFDYLSTSTIDVASTVLAAGIKITFNPTIYGLCIYLLSSLFVFGINYRTKTLA